MVLTSTDVANAVKCTTITLNGFTVPAKKTLTLSLATGTTVTMSECPHLPHQELLLTSISEGDISFGNASWAGPLFAVR